MMNRRTRVAIAALIGLSMLGACGSGGSPETSSNAGSEVLPNGLTVKEQVETRQAQLKKMGKAFKSISDGLKSSEPDMAAIQAAAASVPVESADMRDWFPEGTGPDSGVKTDALAAIWENPADFKEKIASFQAASGKLDTAAQSGDIDAIGDAFKVTGAACKSCHEKYRQDD